MDDHVSKAFLQQKQQSCRHELATIRELDDPIDQALSYEALLYDVLMWQGLSPEVKEHVFSIKWKENRYSLLFWPVYRETVDQKLGLEPVSPLLPQSQTDCILAASLVGFTEELQDTAREANGRILLVDGTDIDALCSIEWSFSQMMRFKLREMALYGQPNVNYLTYSAKRRVEKNCASTGSS